MGVIFLIYFPYKKGNLFFEMEMLSVSSPMEFQTPQSVLTKLCMNTISLQQTAVLHHYISNVHCQHGDLRTYDARETLAELLYLSKVFIGDNRSWINIEYSKYNKLLKR